MWLLWSLKVVLACAFSTLIGWLVIGYLRAICFYTNDTWKLQLLVFLIPISVFTILKISSFVKLCDTVVADAFSFGIVVGMAFKLFTKPNNTKNNVKLMITKQNEANVVYDVWLDSIDATVGEVRDKIAEKFNIFASNKVSIESGKGKFIEELSEPLFAHIRNSMTVDFFGFVTLSCIVCINDDSDSINLGETEPKLSKQSSLSYNFSSMLNTKGEVKYGASFLINASIPGEQRTKCFAISKVNNFVAASLTSDASVIKIEPFVPNYSIEPNSSAKTNSSSSSLPLPKTGDTAQIPIRDGDLVVIVCDDKYMSVTRGWWMLWSSDEIKRSGAFKIEITQYAPQNIDIFSGLEKIGLGTGTKGGTQDKILRTGDLFRLRSIKFPEYELGVTSHKLATGSPAGDAGKGKEYSYLGLRKVGVLNNWCTEVRFSVKFDTFQNITTELVKLDPRNVLKSLSNSG